MTAQLPDQTIALGEYQTVPVALAAEDARYLRDHLSSRITLARSLDGDGFTVNCNQFVGVVTLPSGRRLECRPKVPVGTLFTMLAVAYDLDVPLGDDLASMASLPQLFDFIVSHFVELVDARLSAGFFRDYVEIEDNLLAVRGRIAIAEDVRRNAVLRHRTYCRYTEFTHDVPDNQLIRQVVHLLTGWPIAPRLVTRLRSLDAMMGNITPTHFTVEVLDRFRYDRLKDGYRAIHQFCRLFLDGLSLENQRGGNDFRTFLIDMNALFETFVTRSVATRLPGGLSLTGQAKRSLDVGNRVTLLIDMLFTREGRPVLVADTKYKRIETHGLGNADVYQMLAYCVATSAPTAVLIYPRETASGSDSLAPILVHHMDIRILGLSLDLSGTATALAAELDQLTDRLVALAAYAVESAVT